MYIEGIMQLNDEKHCISIQFVLLANSLEGEANEVEEAYIRQRQVQSPTDKAPLPPKTH